MANKIDNTVGGTSTVKDNQYFTYDGSDGYDKKEDEEYLAEEKKGDELINKYKEMAEMRRDYEDIDIKDCIPTLDEMIQDDMMYEILEKAANGQTEKDVEATAFYTQEPPTTSLGYQGDKGCFIYKVQNLSFDKVDIDLNHIDGNTFKIPLKNIIQSATETSFNIGGKDYTDFKDYCYKKGLVNNNVSEDKQSIQIKLVGVESPEIPHFDIMPVKEIDRFEMTLKDAKKKGAKVLKYDYSNGKVSERDLNKKLEFYKVRGKNEWYEIVGDASEYVAEKVEGAKYKKIVVVDESKKETLAGGYKAKENLMKLVQGKTLYIMLDANGLQAKKSSGSYKLHYNHWWNVGAAISDMIDQWCNYTSKPTLAELSYTPFGIDQQGRFVGAVFSNNDGLSTNVAKFNIADSETKSSPSKQFPHSPELSAAGGSAAAIFDLGSYMINNQIWLDSFSEMTKESYRMRLEFHKQITGIDFSAVRNCTMMIGDTFFLIPPQNIRSLSSIDYEKVGIMRGKGSMVKNNTNREMFVEVDLYFYNGDGVNGIPVDVTMPNGEEVTYHMNGLRSLIAQFKLAPYLPIENQFINDILNIEAVSLVNLTVSTVEGMPRLLRATLTMRDFNYRIYMPDIPIDYSSNQLSEVSEMNPIFAKCFNWEVFRYYYQRMISYGHIIKDYEYNTREYNKELYSRKDILQPAWFCEKDNFPASGIDFYIPDENWLKNALLVKKDKMLYGNLNNTDKDSKKEENIDYGKLDTNTIIDVDGGDLSGHREPNVKVDIGYGNRKYWAYTNSYGQLVKVTASKIILQDDKNEDVNSDGRYYDDEAKVPGVERKDMAEGHVIADSLGGVANAYNITPQNATLNSKGAIYEIEDQIRKAGGCTNFTAIITYPNTDTQIPDHYSYTYTINGQTYTRDFYNSSTGTEELDQEFVEETYDYLDPSAMPFIKYNLDPIELESLSFSLSNNFSDITLKIMDGFAPQYMGASDTVMEITFVTNDTVTLSMVNNLPAHAANIGKQYRRILSCWPIRVRNHYLQLAGVNEVLIDLVEIQNIEGFPGYYEVRMRMTSVDRTLRQRESLRQLENDRETSKKTTATMNSYWDLDNILAHAELYPDLDLPTIEELSHYGFNFIKYRNKKQVYPDPDFYLNYSWPYTAYMIKKNLKDIFYDKIFHDEGKEKSDILDDTSFEFFDQMGMYMYRKLDPYKGTAEGSDKDGKSQNDYADAYDKELELINEEAQTDIKRSKKEEMKQLKDENCADLTQLLIYLTACDVQQGWTLKPGFTAPVVVNELNLAIENLECSGLDKEAKEDENNHAYAKEIFDLRAETIKAIDDYLSDPIDYARYNITGYSKTSEEQDYERNYRGVIQKVVGLFGTETKGQKILQLLNPFEKAWKVTVTNEQKAKRDSGKVNYDSNAQLNEEDPDDLSGRSPQDNPNLDDGPKPGETGDEGNKKVPQANPDLDDEPKEDDDTNASTKPDYNAAHTLDYFAGFIYSAAKCISAEKMFDDNAKEIAWEPRQFRIDKGQVKKDKSGQRVPNCKIEDNGKSLRQADTLEEALSKGKQWGMFQIKIYRGAELKKILKPRSRVTYLSSKELPMYKDKNGNERWHAGFIDPYYNIAGYRSKVGKEYIEKIATNEGHNTIAFIRVLLMHLRRMIIDGEIFSELDVIARDYDKIKETIKIEPDGDDFNQAAKVSADTMYDNGGIFGLPGLMMEQGFLEGIKTYFTFGGLNKETEIEAIAGAVGSEEAAGTIMELIENLPATYKRSFCSRLVLPALMATVEGSEVFDDLIKHYELSELNSLTTGAIVSTSEPANMISRYCRAMNSVGMLAFDKEDTRPETTSDSQKLWNYIMKEAYTKLADDPQAYVLHSYYDMLIHDKRGRLLRAFPTYYMLFVDEGRKIGSWKLFDNFYNMSAVSEIVVSKSRKIPADTCSFVMSNMYTSYAATYDNTTRQQYTDVYGLRDVFNSIFSPDVYVKKEDAIRRRQEVGETAVLQPGVRVHIRMGYGADASKLPIAFNGKIAEIEVSEVVQVVAQGDGIELFNPLNALGDIDAVELSEVQGWFTMAKDIRGSMKRGGESPRTLLAKLLTAKHGGLMKTVARWWSGDRWYGDNPFGIYHFGDNRFNTIFEEGETVQNLYEVCDASLLKGTNELYEARENSMATPTINTTIQDKTFWDILQLCANSGINYCGAVRDFGMRSTICLCKPNHYYAYAYKKIDDENGQTEGKIVERRKPFQQYHFYDSYTDIVYNSIKASEKNMKTNAVGIWESTDMIWGKSQSTVGPIYLDMNIYPEYQKSMTVDTGLVSDGAGGLELNFFTHFSENWASDANDNKVNKALAERVTTNVLRESVSNMYCGELCVLGDLSIKPYDRFYINDFYEDMQGTMEVEAVVYSMNSATGFTTTIYPDAIVRTDDNHEVARQMINGTMASSLIVGITGRMGVIHTLARLDSSLVSALGKLAAGYAASPLDDMVSASVLSNLLKIDKVDDVVGAVKALGSGAFSMGAMVSAAALAAGVYICANNVKSSFGSFLKNIQALTVYPIYKNQRPLLAGMAGHKGAVYGYPYTKADAEDSIQGMIVKSVEWMNDYFPFKTGDWLMDCFTRKMKDADGNSISEYEFVKNKWAQTLPLIEGEAQLYETDNSALTPEERQEVLLQNLHGAASTEWALRGEVLPSIRTKWRLPNLVVTKDDRLADEVYQSYHIAGVNSINDLVTNDKILDLYPIEDEFDIKQGVAKSHPNIKELYIAHSVGNAKVQMPFESGNRIIKFFTETGNEGSYVYDLPMLQEDAITILKLILNDQALKNETVQFLSGTRVNDTKTWKSTGFAFVIDSKKHKAMKNALDNVMELTKSASSESKPIFEYKDQGDKGFVVIVYAPVRQGMNTAPVPTAPKDNTTNNKPAGTTANNNNNNTINKPTSGTTKPNSGGNSNSNNNKVDTPTTPAPSGTNRQRQALDAARDYLDIFDMSKKALKQQLEFDGYSNSEVQYALNNITANWSQEALDAVKDYLDIFDMSIKEIRSQLEFDGYTDNEIQYALANMNFNGRKEALDAAKDYIELFNMSKEDLREQLEFDGYTEEEIQYALDQIFN